MRGKKKRENNVKLIMESYSCNGKSYMVRKGDAGVETDEKRSAIKDN